MEHVAFGVSEWIISIQNQFLDTAEYHKGQRT